MGLNKKTDLTPIQSQIDTLNETVIDYDSRMDGMDSLLTAATNTNTTQGNTISGHTTDLAGHKTRLDGHDTKFDDHYDILVNHASSINSHTTSIIDARSVNRNYLRREKTGNTALASSVPVNMFLDWQTRRQGTGITCNDGTNFVISKTGVYLINACVSITDNTVADGFIAFNAVINGAIVRLSSVQYDENSNISLNGSLVRYLEVGTTITFTTVCNEPVTAIGLVGEARTYVEIMEL